MIADLAFPTHRQDRLAGTLALPCVTLIQLHQKRGRTIRLKNLNASTLASSHNRRISYQTTDPLEILHRMILDPKEMLIGSNNQGSSHDRWGRHTHFVERIDIQKLEIIPSLEDVGITILT
jgi:hypothetical protein